MPLHTVKSQAVDYFSWVWISALWPAVVQSPTSSQNDGQPPCYRTVTPSVAYLSIVALSRVYTWHMLLLTSKSASEPPSLFISILYSRGANGKRQRSTASCQQSSHHVLAVQNSPAQNFAVLIFVKSVWCKNLHRAKCSAMQYTIWTCILVTMWWP